MSCMDKVNVKVDDLQPTEEFIEENLRNVQQSIAEDPLFWPPIFVTKELYIIDGHHRYELALRFGHKYIPALIFDYMSDDIEVYVYGTREIMCKETLIDRYATGKLLPAKSTQHVVKPQER